jgi:hypothetical protein
LGVELKVFVEFLKTNWGILSGITAFFPFFGMFVRAFPAPKPKIRSIQSSVITMIGCSFVIYVIFLFYRTPTLKITAFMSIILFLFAIAMFFLCLYIDQYMVSTYKEYYTYGKLFSLYKGNSMISESSSIIIGKSLFNRLLVILIVHMIAYVLTFMTMTGAFTVLGAFHFWSSRIN